LRADSGWGVVGDGQLALLHQQGGLWERSKLPRGSGAPTGVLFSCILRFPGGLFRYAEACIEPQKSVNLTARGVTPTPLEGQKLYE